MIVPQYKLTSVKLWAFIFATIFVISSAIILTVAFHGKFDGHNIVEMFRIIADRITWILSAFIAGNVASKYSRGGK